MEEYVIRKTMYSEIQEKLSDVYVPMNVWQIASYFLVGSSAYRKRLECTDSTSVRD